MESHVRWYLDPGKNNPKSQFQCNCGVGKRRALKIRVAAQPEKSHANEELVAFLSKELKVGKQQIKLISGFTSRHKRICLVGVDPEIIWFLKKSG